MSLCDAEKNHRNTHQGWTLSVPAAVQLDFKWLVESENLTANVSNTRIFWFCRSSLAKTPTHWLVSLLTCGLVSKECSCWDRSVRLWRFMATGLLFDRLMKLFVRTDSNLKMCPCVSQCPTTSQWWCTCSVVPSCWGRLTVWRSSETLCMTGSSWRKEATSSSSRWTTESAPWGSSAQETAGCQVCPAEHRQTNAHQNQETQQVYIDKRRQRWTPSKMLFMIKFSYLKSQRVQRGTQTTCCSYVVYILASVLSGFRKGNYKTSRPQCPLGLFGASLVHLFHLD